MEDERVGASNRGTRGPLGPPRLTARQREVLALICTGHSSREIARKLNLSVKTIETHRTHVMKRLGVHKATDLVRVAIKTGFVTLDLRSGAHP